MRTFTVYRPNVPTDTHNEDQRNPPDQAQLQVVVFDSGKCVVNWMTAVASTSVFDSFVDFIKIHGHPEYGSYLIWNDQKGSKPVPLSLFVKE